MNNETIKKDYKIFSASIKEKYPAYADKGDYELAQAVINQYPVYSDQVSFDSAKEDPNLAIQIAKEEQASNDMLAKSFEPKRASNASELTAQLDTPFKEMDHESLGDLVKNSDMPESDVYNTLLKMHYSPNTNDSWMSNDPRILIKQDLGVNDPKEAVKQLIDINGKVVPPRDRAGFKETMMAVGNTVEYLTDSMMETPKALRDTVDMGLDKAKSIIVGESDSKFRKGAFNILDTVVEKRLDTTVGPRFVTDNLKKFADMSYLPESLQEAYDKMQADIQDPNAGIWEKGIKLVAGNAIPMTASILSKNPSVAFGIMASIERKSAYDDMIQMGIDSDIANASALAVGAINGAIELAQIENAKSLTAPITKKMVRETVGKTAVKKTATPISKKLAKEATKVGILNTAENVGEEVSQYEVQQIMANKAIDLHNAKHPDEKPLEHVSYTKDLGNVAVSSLMMSMVLAVGGVTVGGVRVLKAHKADVRNEKLIISKEADIVDSLELGDADKASALEEIKSVDTIDKLEKFVYKYQAKSIDSTNLNLDGIATEVNPDAGYSLTSLVVNFLENVNNPLSELDDLIQGDYSKLTEYEKTFRGNNKKSGRTPNGDIPFNHKKLNKHVYEAINKLALAKHVNTFDEVGLDTSIEYNKVLDIRGTALTPNEFRELGNSKGEWIQALETMDSVAGRTLRKASRGDLEAQKQWNDYARSVKNQLSKDNQYDPTSDKSVSLEYQRRINEVARIDGVDVTTKNGIDALAESRYNHSVGVDSKYQEYLNAGGDVSYEEFVASHDTLTDEMRKEAIDKIKSEIEAERDRKIKNVEAKLTKEVEDFRKAQKDYVEKNTDNADQAQVELDKLLHDPSTDKSYDYDISDKEVKKQRGVIGRLASGGGIGKYNRLLSWTSPSKFIKKLAPKLYTKLAGYHSRRATLENGYLNRSQRNVVEHLSIIQRLINQNQIEYKDNAKGDPISEATAKLNKIILKMYNMEISGKNATEIVATLNEFTDTMLDIEKTLRNVKDPSKTMLRLLNKFDKLHEQEGDITKNIAFAVAKPLIESSSSATKRIPVQYIKNAPIEQLLKARKIPNPSDYVLGKRTSLKKEPPLTEKDMQYAEPIFDTLLKSLQTKSKIQALTEIFGKKALSIKYDKHSMPYIDEMNVDAMLDKDEFKHLNHNSRIAIINHLNAVLSTEQNPNMAKKIGRFIRVATMPMISMTSTAFKQISDVPKGAFMLSKIGGVNYVQAIGIILKNNHNRFWTGKAGREMTSIIDRIDAGGEFSKNEKVNLSLGAVSIDTTDLDIDNAPLDEAVGLRYFKLQLARLNEAGWTGENRRERFGKRLAFFWNDGQLSQLRYSDLSMKGGFLDSTVDVLTKVSEKQRVDYLTELLQGDSVLAVQASNALMDNTLDDASRTALFAHVNQLHPLTGFDRAQIHRDLPFTGIFKSFDVNQRSIFMESVGGRFIDAYQYKQVVKDRKKTIKEATNNIDKYKKQLANETNQDVIDMLNKSISENKTTLNKAELQKGYARDEAWDSTLATGLNWVGFVLNYALADATVNAGVRVIRNLIRGVDTDPEEEAVRFMADIGESLINGPVGIGSLGSVIADVALYNKSVADAVSENQLGTITPFVNATSYAVKEGIADFNAISGEGYDNPHKARAKALGDIPIIGSLLRDLYTRMLSDNGVFY